MENPDQQISAAILKTISTTKGATLQHIANQVYKAIGIKLTRDQIAARMARMIANGTIEIYRTN